MLTRARACLVAALRLVLVGSVLLGSGTGHSAGTDPRRDDDQPWTPFQTEFPFYTGVVRAPVPANNVTPKALAIRLGGNAALVFDTDLLRVAAAWTGPFLTTGGVALNGSHRDQPEVAGEQKLGTAPVPGWTDGAGGFGDPRQSPGYGPLPEPRARWNGLRVVGDRVLLQYDVLGAHVTEQPAAVERAGRTAFVRTFRIESARQPLTLLLADAAITPVTADGGAPPDPGAPPVPGAVVVRSAAGVTVAAGVDLPAQAQLQATREGRITLRLPPVSKALFKVVLWQGPAPDLALLPALVAGRPELVETRPPGSGPRWPTPIVTKGSVAPTVKGASYVVDRITTPFPGVYGKLKEAPQTASDWKDNVYRRRIMTGAFDFFPDGHSAAVSTWEGDVWIVAGIDDKLERITWRRFASGLYEPLGLKIVNGQIYVAGRDQITRLIDSDKDGEADVYENFNNQVTASAGFHEFQFDLQTDAAGNFYTSKASPVRAGGAGFGGGGNNGEITAYSGTLQKISKDGKHREIVASGFRAPNGIGVGPHGELTTGDNEGSWQPACPINWVRKGGFYGVEDLAKGGPVPRYDLPLCWLPMSYDNSGGGQVWVTSKRWGPLEGELLHLSYGKSSIYRVLKQKVGEQMQGGVVRVVGGADATQYTGTPVQLTSSAMRGRFNPVDGQLYVVGLRGWQTTAAALSGFDRIRYTGTEPHTVTGLAVDSAGVHLTFSHPLDPESVQPRQFSGQRWNYRRSSNYGSPDYRVSDPQQEGRDDIDIRETVLSPDGRTLTLVVADLRPVNQMLLRWHIRAKDGTPIVQSLAHTIHVVPKATRERERLLAAGTHRRRPQRTDGVEPGLRLTVKSGEETARETATGVALVVPAGEAPSPFVTPQATPRWQATWEGRLTPPPDQASGPTQTLRAEVRGTVVVSVEGREVLRARGDGAQITSALSAAVPVGSSGAALTVSFTPPAHGDAMLRLAARDPAVGFLPLAPESLSHTRTPEDTSDELRARGRALFVERRCEACHRSGTPAPSPWALPAAPSLANLSERAQFPWLRMWLLAPHGVRAGAPMPALLHGPKPWDDASAIAAYLLSRSPAAPIAAAAGAQHADGAALFENLRCAACHSPPGWESPEDPRVVLSGVRDRFGDAARLAAYLKAPERSNPASRMPNFHLSDAEARGLADYLWSNAREGMKPEPTPTNANLLARGKGLVETSGCLSCHDGKPLGLSNHAPASPTGTALSSADPRARGCLADNEKNVGRGAWYALGSEDRAALRAFVAGGTVPAQRETARSFAQHAVSALACAGCHGQITGIPSVDALGVKLKPEWSGAFIAGQVPYKPRRERNAAGGVWMPARMPAFPAYARGIAVGLAASDGYPAHTPPEPAVDPARAAIGRTLVSARGGFSCVTCHGVGAAPATQVFEVEGINLAYSSERLQRDYFQRWMRNPLRLDPATKMPAFFDEEGKSPYADVLGGDADPQIDAIWQYLRLGPKMQPPTVAGAP